MAAGADIRVAELAIAPVKSLRLVHPTAVRFGEAGIADDRRFQVCRAGDLRGLKDARLSTYVADWDPEAERLRIEFPSGRTAEGKLVHGERVEMGRTWDGEPFSARLAEGPWAEALSEELETEVVLAQAVTPSGVVDVAPFTLVSEASLGRLGRELGMDGPIDAERFRMTMLLSGPGEHEEDTWYGRTIRIGEAVVRATGPVPRCAVTTRDAASGVRDRDTLRALNRYRPDVRAPGEDEPTTAPFGVYAEIVRPGTVAVGDGLELTGT